MQFVNEKEILDNAASRTIRRLRRDSMDILKTAVEAVHPADAVRRHLKVVGRRIKCDDLELDLERFTNIYVVGGGKACGAMAVAVEALLGDHISGGVVNVLRGTEGLYKLEKVMLNGVSHPIPNEGGLEGVGRMLSILDKAGEDELIIVLVSGGGSAMMTYPADGIGLSEVQKMTDLLLRGGATINELNSVRKHISAVKGGQMAKRAYPATVLSLILSDVVGDPLDAIASGPTAPDPTSHNDAINVIKRYGIWDETPESIRRRLEGGLRGEVEETPKTRDRVFKRVHNVVVGSNLIAAKAGVERASALGYHTMLLSTRIEGEASQVGRAFAGIAQEITATGNPLQRPAAVVIGGETTVKVRGSGLGGRNQELALGAAIKIEGLEAVVATLATDGIDGPTEAAGAVVDGSTMNRARAMGLEAVRFLDENDSYGFFKSVGDAFLTGPTGTNVNDMTLILVAG